MLPNRQVRRIWDARRGAAARIRLGRPLGDGPLARIWWVVLLRAIVAIAFGLVVIVWRHHAAVAMVTAFGVYAASKAAIRSFARTWAVELADRGVRVNTIVPGPIETEGLRGLAPDEAAADDLVRQLGDALPLGRPGRPEEVANAVLFLASDQSSFVTGSELFADGGDEQQ